MSKNARSAYKGRLTSVLKTINSYLEDEDKLKQEGAKCHLETQLEICDQIRGRYCKVQAEIIANATNEQEREEELNEMDKFLEEIASAEEKLYDLITQFKAASREMGHLFNSTTINDDKVDQLLRGFKEILEDIRENRDADQDCPSRFSKLEPIQVPVFSGEFSEWRSFQNLFNNLVHSNPRLTDAQKLHYLSTKLTGTAKDVISHLNLCDENYPIAWAAVQNRFESKKAAIKTHIERFKQLPPLRNPDAKEMRRIYDITSTTINAMDALDASGRDPWLIYEVMQKLDAETHTLWAQHQSQNPTWTEFQVFFDKRCKALELSPSVYRVEDVPNPNSKVTIPKVKSKPVKSLTIASENNVKELCNICKKSAHKLWKCGKFKSLPAKKRLETVNQLKLCINCISEDSSKHAVTQCPYPPCKHCHEKHNYWVHDALTPVPFATQPTPSSSSSQSKPWEQSSPAVLSNFLPSSSGNARGVVHRSLLKTAKVKILDSHQNVHTCRALLDFGSEISVMTSDLCQKLHLKLQRSPYGQIEGFQGQVSKIKHQVNATLVPLVGSLINLQCQVTPKISSNLPTCQINAEELQFPPNVELADAKWFDSRPVDLLIGAAHEDDVMLDEVYKMGEGKPTLRKSVFGWIVCGKWTHEEPHTSLPSAVCNTISLKSIDETLRKFWEIEELPEESPQSVEHKEVEELYENTTTRAANGQYIVALPLKGSFGELGSNLKRSKRQLYLLENRLIQTPKLYSEYAKIIDEYLSVGIVERVPFNEIHKAAYYMTHHCVVREEAISTKIRIVFNCGSISESGKSLNDVIKVGPVVQPELIEILWRFRRFKIAMSCDIVKMYLQVQLTEEHRDLQRFLWRKSPTDPMTHFRFRTLCFGNAASPYLATKTLIKLAEDEGNQFPEAAQILHNNFYVDDCLVSVTTVEEAKQIQTQLISLLNKAQMKLSKWQSNDVNVLVSVQEDNSKMKDLTIMDSCVKALGLSWNPSSDCFSFKVEMNVETIDPTKRNILRVLARIYDPLGLLAPVTINVKQILQALWKSNIDWDTPIKGVILRNWENFVKSLLHIPKMKIPRWTSSITLATEEQLHMFSDASNLAYGAIVYHITKDENGQISSHMLTAKSKIAPIKTKTIPKLELCAATLGAKLVSKVSKTLKIFNIYCWVDAKVVLAQIQSASDRQDVFTKNRVSTIRSLTSPNFWRHVGTKENPADLVSRGTTAVELENSSLYWHGPTWLSMGEDSWPDAPVISEEETKASETLASILTITNEPSNYLFKTLSSSISSFSRMKRVLLYVYKFVQLLKSKCEKTKHQEAVQSNCTTFHSTKELNWAETQLIKWDQQVHLKELIEDLKNNRRITCSAWRKLHPFLDINGILRVGGRLGHLDDDYNVKYPKILPRSELTKLIIREMHVQLVHAGPQLLLAHSRRKYWPLGGRHITRSIVNSCKTCFVHKATRENQIMADLPKHRISFVKAFHSVSIDCCGPFMIRAGADNRGKTRRVDIVVFICTSTKAVHLEIVSSLSTEAFLSSFRRFISRRGVCKEVFSDNGRNFVGASRELRRMLTDEAQALQDSTSDLKIVWHFQPARSPHFGGLVEAAVKSVKTHLKRVVGDHRLNYEEFYTILTQVEAVLNSRPITVLSDDPRDPQPLTPGHFLLLAPPTQLPDDDLTSANINHLQHWELCQRIVQDFIRKWKITYLHSLQERAKWHTEKENIQVDDVVVLHDASVSKGEWTLGRVEAVHKGTDGRVRVIDIKTPRGTYRRAITNVSKLPRCESHSPPREHV